jgi:hypothetical protein
MITGTWNPATISTAAAGLLPIHLLLMRSVCYGYYYT